MKKVKHTKQATHKPIYFMKYIYVRDRQACKITSRSCQQQCLVQDLPSTQGHNALPISVRTPVTIYLENPNFLGMAMRQGVGETAAA